MWQLWRQFPCAFEFNERFLVTLCYHVYSGRFGNFLYNCEAERVLNGVRQQTPSLWAFIEAHYSSFSNPFYAGPTADTCLAWSPLGQRGGDATAGGGASSLGRQTEAVDVTARIIQIDSVTSLGKLPVRLKD